MKVNKVMLKTLLSVVAAIVGISQYAYCESDGYAMMIQQSPVDAGRVTPSIGIHRFTANKITTLTAIPKPGYRFVYWLGDVIDSTTNETTVIADGPKIIIAVFERTEYEFWTRDEMIMASRGASGSYSKRESIGGRGRAPGGFKEPDNGGGGGDDGDEDEPEDMTDFPVPTEESPVPDPATIALLGLGSIPVLAKRKKRN